MLVFFGSVNIEYVRFKYPNALGFKRLETKTIELHQFRPLDFCQPLFFRSPLSRTLNSRSPAALPFNGSKHANAHKCAAAATAAVEFAIDGVSRKHPQSIGSERRVHPDRIDS